MRKIELKLKDSLHLPMWILSKLISFGISSASNDEKKFQFSFAVAAVQNLYNLYKTLSYIFAKMTYDLT